MGSLVWMESRAARGTEGAAACRCRSCRSRRLSGMVGVWAVQRALPRGVLVMGEARVRVEGRAVVRSAGA